ncbi:hypothetical protein [Sphingomonas bacterium]|uniref:hypothetical protein n=1 Tax=Sphingomonas bacterium TaxID=1895847 RepID=UPI0026268167|nr:hypothetical protein [Sphingomonas bacterium]MDB5677611.1 hypothetical protein [Sphingomonas bacterium]
MFRWVSALMLGLLIAAPAQAEWRKAQTDHFILTIDDTEDGARDFAVRLERFDAALRKLYGVADKPREDVRPITIYAFKNDLFNATCRCAGALAYYRPRADGSFILTQYLPEIDRKAKLGGWSSQSLLLHEYTHHFTFSNFPIAYPLWFQEGFAEFNANSSFEADGSVIIGYPANYRAEGLQNGGDSMSMKQLLAPEQFGYDDGDMLYGRGWLLTHYLILNPARSGQLSAYLTAMNSGVPSLEAGKKAFGDLKKLDGELDAYRKRTLFAPLRVPPSGPIKVTVTTMSRGEAAILPTYALMLDGVDKSLRLGVAMTAEGVAKRYPDDAAVQVELAEIEYIAARYDKADAAADRALAIDPKNASALMRKGQVAVTRARLAKTTDTTVWAAARAWYLQANRIDSNQVMPLYLYYASFVAAKEKPTPGAIKALQRSNVLAPESTGIALALARQMVLDGDLPLARKLLAAVAFAPHAPRDKNVPLAVLKLVDTGKIDEAKAMLNDDKNKSDED